MTFLFLKLLEKDRSNMTLKAKNRFRPIYKPLLSLRENIQNRDKLIRFKKKKWQKLIISYKKKLKLYRKVKPKDQAQYSVSRYPNTNFTYKKQYKTTLKETKKFKLIYGGLLNRTLKILFRKNFKVVSHVNFLKIFESRLDVTLYRSKFGSNIKFIRQLIYQGNVFVNGRKVVTKSFLLTPGDIIEIKPKHNTLIEYYGRKSDNWPLCPKHLTVNYKTMQIVFNSLKTDNMSLNHFYHLKIEKLLLLFKNFFGSLCLTKITGCQFILALVQIQPKEYYEYLSWMKSLFT